MGLTSCLDSNDDNRTQITREDVQKAYSVIAGKHTGKVIYPQGGIVTSATDRTDTLDIAWSVMSDSIIMIHDFPVKPVAERVTNPELKELLLKAPNQDLKCNIGIYSVSPIAFLVRPARLTYSLVDNKGVTRKVEVAFYYNMASSIGYYDAAKAILSMQLIEAAVLVDGQENERFAQGVPILLTEIKK